MVTYELNRNTNRERDVEKKAHPCIYTKNCWLIDKVFGCLIRNSNKQLLIVWPNRYQLDLGDAISMPKTWFSFPFEPYRLGVIVMMFDDINGKTLEIKLCAQSKKDDGKRLFHRTGIFNYSKTKSIDLGNLLGYWIVSLTCICINTHPNFVDTVGEKVWPTMSTLIKTKG